MIEAGAGATLTVGPAELRFASDASIEVGKQHPDALVATRAPFSAIEPAAAPGSWSGIHFGSETTTSSRTNCTVKQAGDTAVVTAAVTLNHTGTNVSIVNTAFSSNNVGDLFIDCDSVPAIQTELQTDPDGC